MEIENENARIRMDGDRISSLPDEIIHLILSSHDIKYAVQTSVLSSRWKLIWTTLPYLNFSTRHFHRLQRFSMFVDRVLSCRNDQAEVHAIYINIYRSVNKQAVNKIANYAVSRNVQKVVIRNFKSNDCKDPLLPLCLFSSQSLTDLCLISYAGNHSYMLPQSPWDSPALTTIELNGVWLCTQNTICLDLFSKCVDLINLTLTKCSSFGLKLMKIKCPRLMHLTISDCFDDTTYEILAPNLTSFCYEGLDTPLLSTGEFSYLEKVNLDIIICKRIQKNPEEIQRKAHDYMNLLNKLRNARSVSLSGEVIVLLSKVLDLPEYQQSPFFNLKCLTIEKVKTSRNCSKSDLTSRVTNYLWNSSKSVNSSIVLPEVRVFVGQDEMAESVLAPLVENVLDDVNDEDATQETGNIFKKSHKRLIKAGKTVRTKGVIGRSKKYEEPLEVFNVHTIEVEDAQREEISQHAQDKIPSTCAPSSLGSSSSSSWRMWDISKEVIVQLNSLEQKCPNFFDGFSRVSAARAIHNLELIAKIWGILSSEQLKVQSGKQLKSMENELADLEYDGVLVNWGYDRIAREIAHRKEPLEHEVGRLLAVMDQLRQKEEYLLTRAEVVEHNLQDLRSQIKEKEDELQKVKLEVVVLRKEYEAANAELSVQQNALVEFGFST